MTNVIVYSFKGYDTAKHRHILRPVKATLERIRRIDDGVAVRGSGEKLPRSKLEQLHRAREASDADIERRSKIPLSRCCSAQSIAAILAVQRKPAQSRRPGVNASPPQIR